MPRLDEVREVIVDALQGRHGPLPPDEGGPIPPPDPFESLVRVGLGLVAEPRKALAALHALREAGMLNAHALASATGIEIEEFFRTSKIAIPAKAFRPIQRIARWVADHGFGHDQDRAWTTESLREEWRAINGIGAATSDRLLLFGLGRPTYPIDRSTYRILARHGWLDTTADYEEARSVAEAIAPDDPETLARLSTGFEKLGRDHCKPASPRCDRCPLREMLPGDGPIELGE